MQCIHTRYRHYATRFVKLSLCVCVCVCVQTVILSGLHCSHRNISVVSDGVYALHFVFFLHDNEMNIIVQDGIKSEPSDG